MADSTLTRKHTIRWGRLYTEKEIDDYRDHLSRHIPVELLREAAKAGVLKSSGQAILSVSECIDYYVGKLNISREEVLTLVQGIVDVEVTAVTGYLVRRYPVTEGLGEWMLSQAAALGNEFAITVLAADHLNLAKAGKTRILHQLENISNRGTNPQAMVVHGTVLKSRGQRKEALEVYKKAMEISKPKPWNPFLDITLNDTIAPPWSAYAALNAEMGYFKEARKALEHGALEYDNIAAISSLAMRAGNSKNWDKYHEYLTKLAMHGNPESAFHLGVYYLKQFYEEADKEAPSTVFTHLSSLLGLTDSGPRPLAIEWFRLAAEYGHSRSALLLAGLLREDYKFKEGILYLGTAEEDPNCSKSAQVMKESFLDRDAVFDLKSELPDKTFSNK